MTHSDEYNSLTTEDQNRVDAFLKELETWPVEIAVSIEEAERIAVDLIKRLSKH